MAILLNLGCGAERPPLPWVNVDDLEWYLGPEGTFGKAHPGPAQRSLADLRRETNYVNYNLEKAPWTFSPDDSVDGVFSCHCLEHLDCLAAVRFLRECFRVMKKEAALRVVVPDASYFRKVYPEDVADPQGNASRLFGEAVGPGPKSFMSHALFYGEHKQALTEDALWCELVEAGFAPDRIRVAGHRATAWVGHPWSEIMAQLDNRGPFSLRMEAVK